MSKTPRTDKEVVDAHMSHCGGCGFCGYILKLERELNEARATINILNRQSEIHNKDYDTLYRQKAGENMELLESERMANEILTAQVEKLERELNEARELLKEIYYGGICKDGETEKKLEQYLTRKGEE
jgi:hypothetical protein